MPDTPLKSATPSKRRDNQDAGPLSRSQPDSSEEVQARVGQPTTEHAPRDGDSFDRSDQATNEDAQ